MGTEHCRTFSCSRSISITDNSVVRVGCPTSRFHYVKIRLLLTDSKQQIEYIFTEQGGRLRRVAQKFKSMNSSDRVQVTTV
jgi:hypothetical protein